MFNLLRDIFWGLRHEQKPAPDVDHVRPSPVELPYDSQEAIALNVDGRLPILPPEIVEQIIIHAGRPLLPPRCAPYEEYFRVRKAYWKRLRGVVSSTRYYRQLLVKRWFAVVILREPCDWDRLQDTGWMGGLRPYIATVISAGGALTSSLRNRTDTKVLLSFDRLTRASLDFHNDFLKSSSSLPHYQLITNLPSSLEFLEILNAHGPDENMIKLASSCCPNLLELRLGRCTMFNNPNCVWWRAHPADHDAYMADRGVEAYAGAVGNLIVGMPRLHTLHIGVYLTPIEAVWAHRVDHRRYHPFPDSMRHENQEGIHNHLHQIALAAANGEDPDPPINYHYPPLAKKEIWEAPCVECEKRFRAPAEDAEMRTACVLSARVWSLRTVSFGSFTSQARTGCSAWQVRPRHSVEGYTLDGYHAAEMLPKVGQEDPPIRFVEVEVGRLDGPENAFQKRKILTFGISNFGNTIVISPPLNEPRISTIF